MAKSRGLNPKQAQFVREYLIDFNALGAAIRSGYSPKSAKAIGSENLTKPDIQAAIKAQIEKRAEKTGITADYVLTSLKSIAERCQQAEPVLDKQGNPTGEYQFREAGANKALELLGKNLKLFTDRIEIDMTLTKRWGIATDEEKAEFHAMLRNELGIG